jgi:hypothetical protein
MIDAPPGEGLKEGQQTFSWNKLPCIDKSAAGLRNPFQRYVGEGADIGGLWNDKNLIRVRAVSCQIPRSAAPVGDDGICQTEYEGAQEEPDLLPFGLARRMFLNLA